MPPNYEEIWFELKDTILTLATLHHEKMHDSTTDAAVSAHSFRLLHSMHILDGTLNKEAIIALHEKIQFRDAKARQDYQDTYAEKARLAGLHRHISSPQGDLYG